MQAFLEKRGVWCAVERWPKDGRKVLYAATRPGLKNPDYTIVTHLDVVDAPAGQFAPRLDGSKLYARGACDTKSLAYAAAKILDTDHYGLEDVKKRILEFIAVLQMNREEGREEAPGINNRAQQPGLEQGPRHQAQSKGDWEMEVWTRA